MHYLLVLQSWKASEQTLLQYINPWWDKDLTKLLKKQNTWLKKFQQDASLYFPKGNRYEVTELNLLIKNSQRYFEFYQQKLKKILQHPKVYRKFQRWSVEVGTLGGLLSGIIFLVDFYKRSETTEMEDKQAAFMELANEKISQLWTRYQREVMGFLPEDYKPYFEELFDQAKIMDKQLFNPTSTVNQALKDVEKLHQKTKISPEMVANFQAQTLLWGGYLNGFLPFLARCLTSLRPHVSYPA